MDFKLSNTLNHYSTIFPKWVQRGVTVFVFDQRSLGLTATDEDYKSAGADYGNGGYIVLHFLGRARHYYLLITTYIARFHLPASISVNLKNGLISALITLM